MYTKCPDCNAVFRVTEEQLKIAEGLVRCGLCDAVFNGQEHIHEDTNLPNTQKELENKHDGTIKSSAEQTHQTNEDELIEPETIPTAIKEDFGREFFSKPNNPLHVALLTVGSIILSIFFLGQITYWQNMDVLPKTWVREFCNVIGCSKLIERDLSSIKILNRNIYTHPNVDNALMITTSFVNEGLNAQPLPQLQVALLNTQGQIVAIRTFAPIDYLINKELSASLLQPNHPVGARLEVFDPGSEVIAYEFEFY